MKHVRFIFEPALVNLLPPSSSPINWTSGSAGPEGENVIKNHSFRVELGAGDDRELRDATQSALRLSITLSDINQ
jgi:hypothetical protein